MKTSKWNSPIMEEKAPDINLLPPNEASGARNELYLIDLLQCQRNTIETFKHPGPLLLLVYFPEAYV